MTAIMMASMGAAAVTTATLETTITVGNAQWFDIGTEDTFFGYGFNDALTDPLTLATIGSIGTATYQDATATTRTISHVLYSDNTFGADPDLEDSIFFGLVGTGIANSDTTFREIEYNGQTYIRSAAHDYVSSFGGVITYWQWQPVTPNGPTSGVRDFKVYL